MKIGLCSLEMPCSSLLLLSPFFFLSLFLSMKSGISLPLSSLIWPRHPHKMAKHGLSRFCLKVCLQSSNKAHTCIKFKPYLVFLLLILYCNLHVLLEPSFGRPLPLDQVKIFVFSFPSKNCLIMLAN